MADVIGGISIFFKMFIIVGSVIALYYLYQFLFKTGGQDAVTLFQEVRNVSQVQPLVKMGDSFPPLMEGGEYSVSFWMYVQNWGARAGYNKHILSIGSIANGFYTMVVYLGANTNTLHVRVQANDPGTVIANTAALTNTNVSNLFNQPVIASGPLANMEGSCDVQNIELQKWTLVNLVLNGKTTDVYIDGKLARSCVHPSFFRVPSGGHQLMAYNANGFGGYMANLTLSNLAMTPDEANRMYQAGPVGITSFWNWMRSFFDPTALDNQFYPKM
jgi:hypothetical protein